MKKVFHWLKGALLTWLIISALIVVSVLAFFVLPMILMTP